MDWMRTWVRCLGVGGEPVQLSGGGALQTTAKLCACCERGADWYRRWRMRRIRPRPDGGRGGDQLTSLMCLLRNGAGTVLLNGTRHSGECEFTKQGTCRWGAAGNNSHDWDQCERKEALNLGGTTQTSGAVAHVCERFDQQRHGWQARTTQAVSSSVTVSGNLDTSRTVSLGGTAVTGTLTVGEGGTTTLKRADVIGTDRR